MDAEKHGELSKYLSLADQLKAKSSAGKQIVRELETKRWKAFSMYSDNSNLSNYPFTREQVARIAEFVKSLVQEDIDEAEAAYEQL